MAISSAAKKCNSYNETKDRMPKILLGLGFFYIILLCISFFSVAVTVSGLSKADKEIISKKITLHGGTFSPDLNMNR
jgi:hypothetical protein